MSSDRTGSPPSASKLSRQDVKRTLQVFLPTVPGPMIDYATSTVFASLTAASAVGPVGGNSGPSSRYTLRKMDSGQFGELSLTSPRERKYSKKKGMDFANPNALNFAWPDAPAIDAPRRR